MRFLLDTGPGQVQKAAAKHQCVLGQLLTPLTRRLNWNGGCFAVDNGAFSRFESVYFANILKRERERREDCLFVVVPDVVGSARRTLELWQHRQQWVPAGWPRALVAQDGQEHLPVPWDEIQCLFIGGGDPWKDSRAAQDLVRTAKILGKHVHVGRVNSVERFELFSKLGADTCDGSGVSKYDHMLRNIEQACNREPEPELELGV